MKTAGNKILFPAVGVRTKGLEPPRRETPDPKSGAATITPRAHLRLQNYK